LEKNGEAIFPAAKKKDSLKKTEKIETRVGNDSRNGSGLKIKENMGDEASTGRDIDVPSQPLL
jgi:hypothetical protein